MYIIHTYNAVCNLFGKSVFYNSATTIMDIFKIDFFTVAEKIFKIIPKDVYSVFSCYENN